MSKLLSPAGLCSYVLACIAVCLLAGVLTVDSVRAQDDAALVEPNATDAAYKVFMPAVQNSSGLSAVALGRVAERTGLPPERLQIVDAAELIFPLLDQTAHEFAINVNETGEVYRVPLDAAGAEVDRAALDAAEAAAYIALGDYEIAVTEPSQPVDADQSAPEDALEPSALGSSFMPYKSTTNVTMGFEYRSSTTNQVCLTGGIISIRVQALFSKTDNAALKVTVEKCPGQGTGFSKDGDWEILVDSASRFGSKRINRYSVSDSVTIYPLAQSWYDTKVAHTYQIKYKTVGETTSKYSGKVTVAVWGRCWCTDYAYQRLGLKFAGYPNAKEWGALLTNSNNGYRKLRTTGSSLEMPRVGDVVVLQPGFPGVPAVGHVGIIQSIDSNWKVTLRQGGSGTGGWVEEYYCYNARSVAWGTSLKNNSYAAVYRK